MRIAVIGAGLSGLTAARRLTSRGHDVTVVDKARAVGGRMASKRALGSRFDIGAQHFSVRSRAFAAEVAAWRAAGVVRTWFDAPSVTEPERGTEARHIGVPAMRSICEHLALGLDVRLDHRVSSVTVESGSVLVDDQRFDGAVVTTPIPQAVEMVALDIPPRLQDIEYEPCLAAMLTIDRHLGVTHRAPDHPTVAWVAENATKDVTDRPSLTVHTTAAFSRTHLEDDAARWLPVVVAAAEEITGVKVTASAGHRWRWSRPVDPVDAGSVMLSEDPPVVLAGEALAAARVEGAFRSGLHAAGRF